MKFLTSNSVESNKININNFAIEFNNGLEINPSNFTFDYRFTQLFLEITETKNEFFSYIHSLYKNPYDIEILKFCLFAYQRFVNSNNPFGYFSNSDLSIYDSNNYSKRIFEVLEANCLIRNLNNTRHRKKDSKTKGYEFTKKGVLYCESIIFAFNDFSSKVLKMFLENFKYYTDEKLTEITNITTIFLKCLTIFIYSVRQTAEKFNYTNYLNDVLSLEIVPLNLCKFIVQNKALNNSQMFKILLSIYEKDTEYKALFERDYKESLKQNEIDKEEEIKKTVKEIPERNRKIIFKVVNNSGNPALEEIARKITITRKRNIDAYEKTKIQEIECTIRETRDSKIKEYYDMLTNSPQFENEYKLLSVLSEADYNYFYYLLNKKNQEKSIARKETINKKKKLRSEGFTEEEIDKKIKEEKKEKKEIERQKSNRKLIKPVCSIEELNKAKKEKQKQREIEEKKKSQTEI